MSRFRLLSLAALVLLYGSPGRVARGDEIPASARRLLEEHDKRVKEIKGKSAQALKDADKKLMDGLQALEASFKKEAKFKQAQAVAKLIQEIKQGPIKALADPGTLVNFRGQLGKVLYFEVTGANRGTVWGTDVYTDDSSLAAAAVHAGVLNLGQKGVVKVTLLPGQGFYQGTARHGITTANWNAWNASYKVEVVRK